MKISKGELFKDEIYLDDDTDPMALLDMLSDDIKDFMYSYNELLTIKVEYESERFAWLFKNNKFSWMAPVFKTKSIGIINIIYNFK